MFDFVSLISLSHEVFDLSWSMCLFVQDHGDLLRQFVATYNPAYTKWSEEFELDAILRYDSLRRSFFVPFVRKTTALNVCDVFKVTYCLCEVEW